MKLYVKQVIDNLIAKLKSGKKILKVLKHFHQKIKSKHCASLCIDSHFLYLFFSASIQQTNVVNYVSINQLINASVNETFLFNPIVYLPRCDTYIPANMTIQQLAMLYSDLHTRVYT